MSRHLGWGFGGLYATILIALAIFFLQRLATPNPVSQSTNPGSLSASSPPAQPTEEASPTSNQLRFASGSFVVSAAEDPPGVDTGMNVEAGWTMRFTAQGTGGYGGFGDCGGSDPTTTDPSGSRHDNGGTCQPRIDPNAVLGSSPIGTLLARIGNSDWVPVGSATTLRAWASGAVFILYNDVPGTYGDNTGAYSVQIATT
jgi:PA-IL-like protein